MCSGILVFPISSIAPPARVCHMAHFTHSLFPYAADTLFLESSLCSSNALGVFQTEQIALFARGALSHFLMAGSILASRTNSQYHVVEKALSSTHLGDSLFICWVSYLFSFSHLLTLKSFIFCSLLSSCHENESSLGSGILSASCITLSPNPAQCLFLANTQQYLHIHE